MSLDKLLCKLPHSIESERLILGAMIRNNSIYDDMEDIISPYVFFDKLHKKLFEHILLIKNRGTTVNEFSLNYFLSNDEDFKDAGGSDYLVRLVSAASVPVKIRTHAEILWENYIRRCLINIGDDIVQSAYDFDVKTSTEKQIESGMQNLFKLTLSSKTGSSFKALKGLVEEYMEIIKQAKVDPSSGQGVTSGFCDLDNLLGGFKKSDLIIIAARPSMGKTALALNIALNAADQLKLNNKNVAIFSLEMSSEQIVSRVVSLKSNTSSGKILTGKLSDSEYMNVINTAYTLFDIPILIDDTPALSVGSLKTRIRMLHYTQGVELVIIDYLQLIHCFDGQHGQQNRVLEIGNITQGLKEIARELSIPILVLSQLSRAVEVREDKKPQLSDLRDSGSIEQDADIVLFIYREEYYLSRKKPDDSSGIKLQEWKNKMEKVMNTAELLIAKHRNGPIGNVKLYFDNRIGLFRDYTDKYYT